MTNPIKSYDKLGNSQREALDGLSESGRGGRGGSWVINSESNTIRILRSMTAYDEIVGMSGKALDGNSVRVVEIEPDIFELETVETPSEFATEYVRDNVDVFPTKGVSVAEIDWAIGFYKESREKLNSDKLPEDLWPIVIAADTIVRAINR